MERDNISQQPQQQPMPQIVYQQRPFPWLGLSQVVILILMVIILRQEFTGGASNPQLALQGRLQAPDNVSIQILVDELNRLNAELKQLQMQFKQSQRVIDTERKALNNKIQSQIKTVLQAHKQAFDLQNCDNSEKDLLVNQIKKLEQQQANTHKILEKLRIRVLAKDGISPRTVGKKIGLKNRLVGYKPTVKQPKTTKKTPTIVRSQNSNLAIGSVGKPPIEDFATKWLKQWNTQISNDKDNLKRRSFVYKMLSHPQSRQGIMVYLKAMDDKDPVVRNFAVTALREATGKDFGYSPSAPREQRLQGIKAWKAAVAQ